MSYSLRIQDRADKTLRRLKDGYYNPPFDGTLSCICVKISDKYPECITNIMKNKLTSNKIELPVLTTEVSTYLLIYRNMCVKIAQYSYLTPTSGSVHKSLLNELRLDDYFTIHPHHVFNLLCHYIHEGCPFFDGLMKHILV
jgi:hypothetical protein